MSEQSELSQRRAGRKGGLFSEREWLRQNRSRGSDGWMEPSARTFCGLEWFEMGVSACLGEVEVKVLNGQFGVGIGGSGGSGRTMMRGSVAV